MDTVVIIGYIAGALTTISFVPQVIRTWKLKRDQGFLAGNAPALCSGDAPLDRVWDLDQFNSHHCSKYRYFWAGSHPSLDEGQIPVIRIFYS